MIDYTQEQLTIFEHNPDCHGCILAGPGTGKSSTIIGYISKLYKTHPDKKVRLLTFTRAANGELVDKILKAGHEKLESSTMHSFAISVLLANPGISGLPEPLRIADDWEWDELIRKDIARRLNTNALLVDKLKNEMSAHWESLVPEQDANIPSKLRSRFMGMWDEHRRVFGYTLLSELPFRLKLALEAEPNLDIGGITLLAVDEYQDLNSCDLKCLRYLADRGVTIFAIGDDDQSIYQFRKAHPAGIRNFPTEYNADLYPLTISHRCGRKILECANYVIEGDTTRPSKEPVVPADKNPEGCVGILVFNREQNEADGIVSLVKWLTNKNKVPLEEILILARTGTVTKLIKKVIEKADIPYSDPDDALQQMRRPESRELFSILRLLSNKFDSLAWWTLLYLTKGIGNGVITQLYALACNQGSQFGEVLMSEAETGYKNTTTGEKTISNRVNQILGLLEKFEVPDSAQWGKWILEQIEIGILPAPPAKIIELLVRIDDWKEDIEQLSLSQYINQIEPLTKDIMNSKIPNCLRIMTLSRSKGLTVRATIIAGVEKDIIPHPYGDYQEERRLLYVGMTRAREFLFLTRSRRRTGPTARSGISNVAGRRCLCPFLEGGPINQLDGDNVLKKLLR